MQSRAIDKLPLSEKYWIGSSIEVNTADYCAIFLLKLRRIYYMNFTISMLISVASTSIIAFLSWIATKNEVKKRNLLMKEYQQFQDERHHKQDKDKILKN